MPFEETMSLIYKNDAGNKRVNIQEIIGNPVLKRKLMVDCIIASQAREGITTTRAQAEAAYDKVLAEGQK